MLGASALLLVGKLAITAVLTRLFGLRWLVGLQAGLLLGPGGEFGFVILGLARAEHLLGQSAADFLLILTALTMACIPLLSGLGNRIVRRAAGRGPIDPELLAAMPVDASPRVLLAGFGRVGETVASMLDVHRVPMSPSTTTPIEWQRCVSMASRSSGVMSAASVSGDEDPQKSGGGFMPCSQCSWL